MHDLLYKMLKQRGIENLDQLDQEERLTFDNWREILNKEELTIKDIKEFCRIQCEVIRQKWADYNIEQSRKNDLIAYFTVYNSLLSAIDSPKVGKEALEAQLKQMTNK
jgi:hypothetical protein